MYDYVVTADDVDTVLAVQYNPMDEDGLQVSHMHKTLGNFILKRKKTRPAYKLRCLSFKENCHPF